MEWWSDAAVVYFPEYANNMFYYSKLSGAIDLSAFDTSKVVETEYMFYNCDGITTIDMTGWNLESVKSAKSMFLPTLMNATSVN